MNTTASPDATVFVVDDHASIRDALSLLISLRGLRASMYSSAEDASSAHRIGKLPTRRPPRSAYGIARIAGATGSGYRGIVDLKTGCQLMKLSYFLCAFALITAGCSQQSAAPAVEEPVAQVAPEKSTGFGVQYESPTAQEIEQARLKWLSSGKPSRSDASETTKESGTASGS